MQLVLTARQRDGRAERQRRAGLDAAAPRSAVEGSQLGTALRPQLAEGLPATRRHADEAAEHAIWQPAQGQAD
jgi:hypothetical protein